MKKKSIIGIFITAILCVGAIGYSLGTTNSPSLLIDTGIKYTAEVCPVIERVDGTVEVIPCSSNVLTYNGSNATRDYLGVNGTRTAFEWIGLNNASFNVGATNDSLPNESIGGGMDRAGGLYTAWAATSGNFTISHQFTASHTQTIWGAGLFNASVSNETMLAVNNFTTEAALVNGDLLNVTWNVAIT